MIRFRRALSVVLALCLSYTGLVQSAQAALIGTEEVAAASQTAAVGSGAHARLLSTLDRADVAAALVERGVDLNQARERVAALTDAEAAAMAEQIDQAPAGGIIGVIVFLFLVLLVTDILGLTKVFPFTRSVR